MSLMQCRSCPARFTVGLLRCPHCQAMSELFAQPGTEGEGMPKITVAGGPSNAADAVEDVTPEAAVPEVDAQAATPEPDESSAEADAETQTEPTPEVTQGTVPDKAADSPKVTTASKATSKAAAKKAAASKP